MDEAGGIPAWLWDAVKTITTGPECRVLAIGNPDDNSSEFARVCQQDPTWSKIKISAYDSPNFTDEDVPLHVKEHLVSREWVSDVARSWGEDSPLFKAKVLGEFADSESGLIPLSWVVAANTRWRQWAEHRHALEGRTVLGVDVGHFGGDRTVVATRKGDVVTQVDAWSKKDTVEVANIVEARCREWVKPVSVVDGIGVGAGVVDTLRVRGLDVIPFIASKATRLRDATGEQMFSNVRAAAWWHLRELLDPNMDARLCLPPNDELTADLITPRYEPVTGGRIKLESKDDIRKRLGRSTDYGDAVVQCMWAENYEREYAVAPAMALQPLEWLDKLDEETDWDDF
jgi:hypothetical protein